MHPYGDVELGLSGANMEQILSIAAATDGGRRFVIAMGDFNIRAEVLESSGILDALHLTLIRAGDGLNTCSMGSGSHIDYALVTTAFVPAIVSINAVRSVP